MLNRVRVRCPSEAIWLERNYDTDIKHLGKANFRYSKLFSELKSIRLQAVFRLSVSKKYYSID